MRSAMNSLIMVLYRNLRIFFNGIVIHSDELLLSHFKAHFSMGSSMVVLSQLRNLFQLLVGTPSNAEFILQETSAITGCPVDIVKTYEISQSLSLENQMGIRITLPVAFVVK